MMLRCVISHPTQQQSPPLGKVLTEIRPAISHGLVCDINLELEIKRAKEQMIVMAEGSVCEASKDALTKPLCYQDFEF